MNGTIMRFDTDRGFGFIKPDQGGKDLFTHISELRRIDAQDLQPGLTRVSFEVADSGRGPKAVNVCAEPAETRKEWASDREYAVVPDDGWQEPAQPTEAAWRELWQQVSDAAFETLITAARANGWVQE